LLGTSFFYLFLHKRVWMLRFQGWKTPKSTARVQQWQESSKSSSLWGRRTRYRDWENDRCLSYLGGREEKRSRHRERDRPYIRDPVYFYSHATRIMRMGDLPSRRTGFLTSSLFPYPRNRRLERFVKGGDRTIDPKHFHPIDESVSILDCTK